jgi:hypothetical protein
MKTIINAIGSIGAALGALGAVAGLLALFLPDPVTMKLDQIIGQI